MVRHALYTFRSLVTDTWVKGRIILAGDAAHVMPPFMGQGMCAGIRDVWNLSWKLDKVLRGTAGESLLKTYEEERKPHVTEVIKLSMFLGSIICMPDKEQAAQRDAEFFSDNPPQMQPFPHLTSGFIAKDSKGEPSHGAGLLSPHGTVRYQRRTGRLDRFTKSNTFKILVENHATHELLDAKVQQLIEMLNIDVVVIADKKEAKDNEFADTQEQLLPFMHSLGVKLLLVRPDLYLFGTASNNQELDVLLQQLQGQADEFNLNLVA